MFIRSVCAVKRNSFVQLSVKYCSMIVLLICVHTLVRGKIMSLQPAHQYTVIFFFFFLFRCLASNLQLNVICFITGKFKSGFIFLFNHLWIYDADISLIRDVSTWSHNVISHLQLGARFRAWPLCFYTVFIEPTHGLYCSYTDWILVTLQVWAPVREHTVLNSDLSFSYRGCQSQLESLIWSTLCNWGRYGSMLFQGYLCKRKSNDLHLNSNPKRQLLFPNL